MSEPSSQLPAPTGGEIILYQTEDVRTINEHIQNVFEAGELSPDSVIRKFRITAADGKTYETLHYNEKRSREQPRHRIAV